MHLFARSNIVEVTNNLEKKTSRIRTRLANLPYRLARMAQANLRQQMLPNKWTGYVYNNLLAHSLNDTTAIVTSVIEGIYLDRMKPHYVKLTPRRLIWFWAYSKGNEKVRKVADRQGSLWVKPHPFINTALKKTFDEAGKTIKDSIK